MLALSRIFHVMATPSSFEERAVLGNMQFGRLRHEHLVSCLIRTTLRGGRKFASLIMPIIHYFAHVIPSGEADFPQPRKLELIRITGEVAILGICSYVRTKLRFQSTWQHNEIQSHHQSLCSVVHCTSSTIAQ